MHCFFVFYCALFLFAELEELLPLPTVLLDHGFHCRMVQVNLRDKFIIIFIIIISVADPSLTFGLYRKLLFKSITKKCKMLVISKDLGFLSLVPVESESKTAK